MANLYCSISQDDGDSKQADKDRIKTELPPPDEGYKAPDRENWTEKRVSYGQAGDGYAYLKPKGSTTAKSIIPPATYDQVLEKEKDCTDTKGLLVRHKKSGGGGGGRSVSPAQRPHTNRNSIDNLDHLLGRTGMSSPTVPVPSSSTLRAPMTKHELRNLKSKMHKTYETVDLSNDEAVTVDQQGRIFETENKKQVTSEYTSSMKQEDSRTIESNIQETTEVIVETVYDIGKGKRDKNRKSTVEKRTTITSKVDSKTIKDTNFVQTTVKKTNTEILNETRFGAGSTSPLHSGNTISPTSHAA